MRVCVRVLHDSQSKQVFVVAHMSTYFAVASGLSKCAVTVLRVCGPRAFDALTSLTPGTPPVPPSPACFSLDVCAGARLPPPRQACVRWLKDPSTLQHVDQALVTCFPRPHSFTGEVRRHVTLCCCAVDSLCLSGRTRLSFTCMAALLW